MRRWMMVMTGILIWHAVVAQKYWDGGAGTDQWTDAANWFPDGAPVDTDQVVLDHQWIPAAYQVSLPAGTQSITIRSLLIAGSTESITLVLPQSNTANPGISVTHTGDALTLGAHSIFINASGASAGSGLALAGALRILNGGKYVHQTARSNAGIIDRISTAAGTETGIFEFNVPGTAGYTVSLTGNNFGSLHFRAAAAGGTKSYSGSGSGTLTIRGHLLIDTGAQVTSTLTADLVLGGDLLLHGRLSLQPTTAGSVARSLRFIGPQCTLGGTGTLVLGNNFRIMEVARNAGLTLRRNLSLLLPVHTLLCRGFLDPDSHYIDGPGQFILADTGRIRIVDPEGITSTDQGPVRTAQRSLSSRAAYDYEGSTAQNTGNGLPDSIAALSVRNPQGLQLSKNLYIRDSLQLLLGKISSNHPQLLTLGPCKVLSPASRYGPGNQGYEQSFINGPVGLHLVQGGQVTVPLGADTVFAPVTVLKNDPGTETRILEYHQQVPPSAPLVPPLIRLSNREHWSWDQPVTSSLTVGISLRPWSLDINQADIPAVAGLAGEWTLLGTGQITAGYNWLPPKDPVPGLSAIAPAVADQAIILPLSILSFSAREENDHIILTWEAEEENRSTPYTITRSHDGISFSAIGHLYSQDRNRVRHYWQDLDPPSVAYYQLIMGDSIRGIRSRVIRKVRGGRQARIYPNPVNDLLTINFSTASSRYEVEIVSITGTVCKKFVCNTAISQVRVGDLKRGFYLLRLKNGTDWVTLPFSKD